MVYLLSRLALRRPPVTLCIFEHVERKINTGPRHLASHVLLKRHGILKCAYQNNSSSSVSETSRTEYHERDNGYGKYCKYLLVPVGGLLAILAGYTLNNNNNSDCASSPIPEESIEKRPSTQLSSSLLQAITEAQDLAQQVKDESGSPGLVIAVSIDGKTVWTTGMGYSDVENRVLCKSDTVMRIASISKSITMAAVARLVEEKKLDLDKPVQHYVPSWPKKTFEGSEVTITSRHLVSHLSGVRHYDKTCGKKDKKKKEETNTKEGKKNETESSKTATKVNEFEEKEYFLKKRYNDVTSSLELFKNDDLCFHPGKQFLYTTFGWTLLSAVVEGASDKKFPQISKDLFYDLGMDHTSLDLDAPIIYNRTRYYDRNNRGRLVNAPYVDCSYKWAGGGFVSTVGDLLKFGNAMLYSYQASPESGEQTPGYLKPETMKMLWTPVEHDIVTKGARRVDYGMGWDIMPQSNKHGQCRVQKHFVSHTGGAIGASSVLMIMPGSTNTGKYQGQNDLPNGVVVAIIANLTSVGLSKTAREIAQIFCDTKVCD